MLCVAGLCVTRLITNEGLQAVVADSIFCFRSEELCDARHDSWNNVNLLVINTVYNFTCIVLSSLSGSTKFLTPKGKLLIRLKLLETIQLIFPVPPQVPPENDAGKWTQSNNLKGINHLKYPRDRIVIGGNVLIIRNPTCRDGHQGEEMQKMAGSVQQTQITQFISKCQTQMSDI